MLILMMLSACSAESGAQIENAEILFHPDSNVVVFYQQNEQKIRDLQRTVEASTDEESRVGALIEMATEYPLIAEFVARQHVTDASENVAVESISILQGALVMSDHPMPHDMSGASPRLKYMHSQHAASKAALRTAVLDERPAVRTASASFLASLSDLEGLDAIVQGAQRGLYSELEAANLFTLASNGVGESYLQAYVGKGELEAQQTAVAFLGSNPEYQPTIRDSYFLNSDAPSVLRVEAAKALSVYDAEFTDYGLEVIEQEEVSPELYETTMDGYLRLHQLRQNIDRDRAKYLLNKTEVYIRTQNLSPEISEEMKKLTRTLQELSGETDK